jgi:hypothetical protein
MLLTYDGRDYEVDLDKVTIDEWRQLKAKYKLTPAKFQQGLSEADPDASTFFYWIMLRRGGPAVPGNQRVPLSDDLRPDIIALNRALEDADEKATLAELDALEAEAEAKAEAERERPTQPSSSPAVSPPAPVTPGLALPVPGEVTAAAPTG